MLVADPTVKELNIESPLTQGLVFCAFLGGTDQMDLVGKAMGTPSASYGDWNGSSLQGHCWDNTVGGDIDSAFIEYPLSQDWSRNTMREVSMVVVVDLDDTPSYNQWISVPYRVTGWTKPYQAISFAQYSVQEKMRLSIAENSNSLREATETSASITTGLHSYGVVRRATTVDFYKDGSITESGVTWGSDPGDGDWGEKRPITLANQSSSSAGSGLDGRMLFAAVWNRRLSHEEMNRVMSNPQVLLRYHGRSRYKIYIAGAGVVTLATTDIDAVGNVPNAPMDCVFVLATTDMDGVSNFPNVMLEKTIPVATIDIDAVGNLLDALLSKNIPIATTDIDALSNVPASPMSVERTFGTTAVDAIGNIPNTSLTMSLVLATVDIDALGNIPDTTLTIQGQVTLAALIAASGNMTAAMSLLQVLATTDINASGDVTAAMSAILTLSTTDIDAVSNLISDLTVVPAGGPVAAVIKKNWAGVVVLRRLLRVR
jgi:hypothetical protein